MAMYAPSAPLPMPASADWADLVAQRCGLVFGPTRRRRLSQALAERMNQTGLSANAYWDLVQKNPNGAEWHQLLKDLVIGETCFFRHRPSFHFLEKHILPDLVKLKAKAPTAALHLLSAGCSNGPEAFSLAISASRCFEDNALPLQITGLDILPEAVAAAQRGQFTQRQLRGLSPVEMDTYFHFNTSDNHYQARADLQNLIEFKVGNILDETLDLGGPYDLIFCQNLFIYFSKTHRQQVLSKFTNCLNHGGYIILGPAEIYFSEDPRLQKVEVHQALVFQRSDHPAHLKKGAS